MSLAAREAELRATDEPVLKLGWRLIHGMAERGGLDGRLLTRHTVTCVRPTA